MSGTTATDDGRSWTIHVPKDTIDKLRNNLAISMSPDPTLRRDTRSNFWISTILHAADEGHPLPCILGTASVSARGSCPSTSGHDSGNDSRSMPATVMCEFHCVLTALPNAQDFQHLTEWDLQYMGDGTQSTLCFVVEPATSIAHRRTAAIQTEQLYLANLVLSPGNGAPANVQPVLIPVIAILSFDITSEMLARSANMTGA